MYFTFSEGERASEYENGFCSCPVCDVPFSLFSLPKVLDCGHSTCLPCLDIILSSVKVCPVCGENLLKETKDYVTNHHLASLGTCLKRRTVGIRKNDSDPVSSRLIYCLRDLHKVLKEKERKITQMIEEKKEMKVSIQRDISEVDLMIEKLLDICDRVEAERLINKGKTDLKRLDKVMFNICNINLLKILNLDNISNTDIFLREVFARIQTGNLMFVCDVICELNSDSDYSFLWLYGKLSIKGEIIHCHCMSLSKVDENSDCVTLHDMKRSMESEEILVFFDFGKHRLYFFPINSSALTLNFIKLCTGETGLQLKGVTASPNDNVSTASSEMSYTNNDLKTEYYEFWPTLTRRRHSVDYLSDHPSEIEQKNSFSKGDLIIQSYGSSVYFIKVSEDGGTYKNIVAKISPACTINFSDINPKTIDDCGTSFLKNIYL